MGDTSALPTLDRMQLTDTGTVSDDMASYPVADMARRAIKLIQLRELVRNHASANGAMESDSNL